MRGRMWGLAVYMFVLGFILNLLGIVSHVVVSSFAKRWFGTPFPRSLTTEWYSYAWKEFGLAQVLGVTIFVALTVVALTLLMGFPAAYILARRNFKWKPVLLLLYFLPILIPQMTYGIPLATTMFRYGIGGTVTAVILAVMVPMVPLAIFILMPFFEQISVNLEWGAAMMGANRLQIFRRVLLPLPAGAPHRRDPRPGEHGVELRTELPGVGCRLPDAGRGPVLQRLCGRGAPRLFRGCHGRDVYDHGHDSPHHRPALCAPDADGLPPRSAEAMKGMEEMKQNETKKVNPQQLERFVSSVFQRVGIPVGDADLTASILVEADLRGIDSHGVMTVSYTHLTLPTNREV